MDAPAATPSVKARCELFARAAYYAFERHTRKNVALMLNMTNEALADGDPEDFGRRMAGIVASMMKPTRSTKPEARPPAAMHGTSEPREGAPHATPRRET